MSYTPFKSTSPRAIAGIGFQKRVLKEFQNLFPNIQFEMTWDYFKTQDPSLTDRELAIIEKKEGDITYVFGGERHFVECCFAMGEKLSRLCEMKRKNFIGQNKWYCYGFANSNDIIFIPSFVWQSYTAKIKTSDKSCRMVPVDSIKSIKAGCSGLASYWENVHGVQQ